MLVPVICPPPGWGEGGERAVRGRLLRLRRLRACSLLALVERLSSDAVQEGLDVEAGASAGSCHVTVGYERCDWTIGDTVLLDVVRGEVGLLVGR